eukprot:1848403-Rhodomonas_salina.1
MTRTAVTGLVTVTADAALGQCQPQCTVTRCSAGATGPPQSDPEAALYSALVQLARRPLLAVTHSCSNNVQSARARAALGLPLHPQNPRTLTLPCALSALSAGEGGRSIAGSERGRRRRRGGEGR